MDSAIEERGESCQKNEPTLEIQQQNPKGPSNIPPRIVIIDP